MLSALSELSNLSFNERKEKRQDLISYKSNNKATTKNR